MSISINSMSPPCREAWDRLLLHSLTMPDAGDVLSARNIRLVFENVCKPLEVRNSNHADRPCFHCWSDASSTPSSPPEKPASWPPRPDLTGLSLTRVAGRVVSFPACTPLNTLRHHAVPPVVMSLSSSLMPTSSIPHVVCTRSDVENGAIFNCPVISCSTRIDRSLGAKISYEYFSSGAINNPYQKCLGIFGNI